LPVDYARLCRAVEAKGLIARGGFYPNNEDKVPALTDGRDVTAMVLVGVAGRNLWDSFQAAPESAQPPNPLDRWSRRVVGELATEFDAVALFPFGGPPFLPFIRWAQRAEDVYPSPIGPLIHPQFGLWHAYRGALAFSRAVDLPAQNARPRPCDTCIDRPCLSACPVGAFSGQSYDVPACIEHIDGRRGADCLAGGCIARRACPVGVAYQYTPEQMGFHMRAFVAGNRRPGHGNN
jgi:hypothetical protein